jgi:hypothetical protein
VIPRGPAAARAPLHRKDDNRPSHLHPHLLPGNIICLDTLRVNDAALLGRENSEGSSRATKPRLQLGTKPTLCPREHLIAITAIAA